MSSFLWKLEYIHDYILYTCYIIIHCDAFGHGNNDKLMIRLYYSTNSTQETKLPQTSPKNFTQTIWNI